MKFSSLYFSIAIVYWIFTFIHCGMSIISPGVTSNYRLTKLGGTNTFEEKIFYGKNYDVSAFYIKKEYLQTILSDYNNLFSNWKNLDKIKNLKLSNENGNLILLCEICFDLEKEIQESDFLNYKFFLNNSKPNDVIEFLYPYNYYIYGTSMKKNGPMIRGKEDLDLILSDYKYIPCIRYLMSFNKILQIKGNNFLRIKTSRDNYFDFKYEYDIEFIQFWNEPSEFRVGIGTGGNRYLNRLNKK